MLLCTSWKVRPLTPEAAERMMGIWGKLEAEMAGRDGFDRVCWYSFADGSGGFSVVDVADQAHADAFGLETTLALGEFLEFDTRPVFDLETALPAITKAIERTRG